ncbi:MULTISPECIES: ABC transporter ATP-binding protein [Variovorax]|uniref:ABC transporter ATP-binding protein n=1 Tax=Variovorax TaxID=34072 RepID=UPI00339A8174
MNRLQLESLCGGYAETDILKGVDLHVDAGEIVTVAGTNGAGKSTMLKALMGLLPRVTGKVLWNDTDLRGRPTEKRLADGIAYVPQIANVFARLSVRENLWIVQGVPDVRRRADEMLELFPALQPFVSRLAGTLSGGERQQLAFARALMSGPSLMCLDEPTAALSPIMAKTIFGHIARLPSMGVAVLMVEQRARDALDISHRGYILDQGRVALEGPARSLLDDPRAVALYLGHGA